MYTDCIKVDPVGMLLFLIDDNFTFIVIFVWKIIAI